MVHSIGYMVDGIWYIVTAWSAKIRILEAMVSGIPLLLGPRTRMWDPHVYVSFLGPLILLVVSSFRSGLQLVRLGLDTAENFPLMAVEAGTTFCFCLMWKPS